MSKTRAVAYILVSTEKELLRKTVSKTPLNIRNNMEDFFNAYTR